MKFFERLYYSLKKTTLVALYLQPLFYHPNMLISDDKRDINDDVIDIKKVPTCNKATSVNNRQYQGIMLPNYKKTKTQQNRTNYH